ncbi:class I tRNA ligase family protein [bacterium]|nr:class I tRNA ligase family protein [bacterium]
MEEALRTYLIPLWNAYHFFCTYANIAGYRPGVLELARASRLDRYILSKLERVKQRVAAVAENYDIVSGCTKRCGAHRDAQQLVHLAEPAAFLEESDKPENRAAYDVLYFVLREFAQVAAPLAPFIAETLYRGLCGGESVHLCDWPAAHPEHVDEALESRTDRCGRSPIWGGRCGNGIG